VRRGMALVQPGSWAIARQLDVRIRPAAESPAAGAARPWAAVGPRGPIALHVGSARTPVKVRMLGSEHARLTLRDKLPLHVGDRVLLRDAGASQIARDDAPGKPLWRGLWGADVLDINPPPLNRRGAAAAAGKELASWPALPGAGELIQRRGLVREQDLAALGVSGLPEPIAAGWLAHPVHWANLSGRLAAIVAEHADRHPLAAGLPADAAREALRLPDRRLVPALAAATDSVLLGSGGLTVKGRQGGLPPRLATAVDALIADFAERPFDSPDAARLHDLGLDKRDLAAAARHGALLRLTDQIVLAPGAGERAAEILAKLDQPFTTAQARIALGSTRRTVIPLLEHLDSRRVTQRLPDDRRKVR